jgi:FMN phosphatase YigB (HAD superfamily)
VPQLPGDLLFYKDTLNELYLKFKNIVPRDRIDAWIMQFEPEHRDLAMKLAQKLAYFSHEEVSGYCRRLYARLLRLGVRRPCFVGFGGAAESGPFIGYLFRKANRLPQRDFLSLEEIRRFNPKKHDGLVLLDDFVGTGVQAIDLWKRVSMAFALRRMPPIVYLALVGFRDAKEIISQDTDMKVELAQELTDVDRASFPATFGDSFKTKAAMRTLAEYGRRIEPNYPLGYDNSAALVAFYYDTPNNTLPVVWSTEADWIPLFQRHGSRSLVAQNKKQKGQLQASYGSHVRRKQAATDSLDQPDTYAQYLAQHEAVFDWEAPQNQSFFNDLNSKGLVAVVKVGKNKLYALPHLAIAAGLVAGWDSLVSLATFSGLPTNAVRETVNQHTQVFEVEGPRILLRKLRGKIVIFDWSDTLVDEYDLDEAICAFIPLAPASRQEEQSSNVVAFREMLADLERNRSKLWYDYLHLGRQFGKSSEDLRREHLRNASQLRSLCNITSLLKSVRKAGFSIGLSTNCIGPVLRWRAKMLGLDIKSAFDFVVTSDKVSSVEDKGGQLDYILKQSNFAPSDVIVVGDSFDKDILPAKMRGMQTVWVRGPIHRSRSYWGTPELPTPHSTYELARTSVLGKAADIMILDVKNLVGALGLRDPNNRSS